MIVFRPPHITGKTNEEKIDQIIRYLQELVKHLQLMQQER